MTETGEWMTYAEAAKKLGLPSAEAARQKAIRSNWAKTLGNDGKARVRIPEGVCEREPDAPDEQPVESPDTDRSTERLIAAFESHVASLRAEVAHLREDASAARRELAEERAKAEAALAEHIRIREQLAEAKAMLAAASEKYETRRPALPWPFRRSA